MIAMETRPVIYSLSGSWLSLVFWIRVVGVNEMESIELFSFYIKTLLIPSPGLLDSATFSFLSLLFDIRGEIETHGENSDCLSILKRKQKNRTKIIRRH